MAPSETKISRPSSQTSVFAYNLNMCLHVLQSLPRFLIIFRKVQMAYVIILGCDRNP